MRPLLPHRAHTALVRVFAEARRRRSRGEVVVGHHNSNHILPLGQPLAFLLGMESGQVRAKFRVPFETVEVVPRIWRESEVLRVVSERLSGVPRCLADFGAWSLHAYVQGAALSEERHEGPVGEARMAALADFFAALAGVPAEALPEVPADWPRGDDSGAFLHRLARFTEEQVDRPNRARFGRLFDAVGVPDDVVGRFVRSVPKLDRRPFALLHTDVHRANVVVTPTPDGGERLSVLDWELSLYGDPLHDLATHLVRMDYDETERKLMTELWTDAMRRTGHTRLTTAGLERDLRTYIGFEYVQSVFPDVMRAALALPEEPAAKDYAQAAHQVCRALDRVWRTLDLKGGPVTEPEAVRALRVWHAEDSGTRAAARTAGAGAGYCPDADRPRGLDRDRPRGAAGVSRIRRERELEPARDPGSVWEPEPSKDLERHVG